MKVSMSRVSYGMAGVAVGLSLGMLSALVSAQSSTDHDCVPVLRQCALDLKACERRCSPSWNWHPTGQTVGGFEWHSVNTVRDLDALILENAHALQAAGAELKLSPETRSYLKELEAEQKADAPKAQASIKALSELLRATLEASGEQGKAVQVGKGSAVGEK